jgi:hypothetical protein
MDVTGFLCLSLGSSIVQLHDSLGTHARAPVQGLVSVVKMATMLVYITEEQHSPVHFLWAEGLNAKDIH